MADQQPAYANYLIPQSATSVIPQQLGNDYLSNLEQQLNQQEQQQMNQALASANQMGTASSGNTNFNLAQIAGNTEGQFANAYTGLANQATGQAQGQQFQQGFEQQGFQNQLQAQQQQAYYQRALANLQASLMPGYSSPSFGQVLGQSFAGALPGATMMGIGGLFNSLGSLGGATGGGNMGALNLPGGYQDVMNPGMMGGFGSGANPFYGGMMNTGGI